MTTDKDRKDKRARQTTAQRRYAKRLKERGIPRRDEIARALLRAVISAVEYPIPPQERPTLQRIVNATQRELFRQGFAKKETHVRLRVLFGPKGPISS
jgi:hypothetical protein